LIKMTKRFRPVAALILGLAVMRAGAQTENDVWPKGVNGPRVWPHEVTNSFSNAGSGWKYPEGGEPPPTDLFQRAKCPDGTAKIHPKNVNSAKWETSRWHPPQYAFDDFTMTRWSSWDKNANWIAADLGSAMTVKRVYLVWETAYGKDYDIQVSDDSVKWTAGKEVRGGNGQADVVDLDAHGRYIQMMGINGGSTYGYSLYEFTICAQASGTASRKQASRAASRRWGLSLNKDGLPQGVRAFDMAGKTLSGSRPAAFSSVYILP
jgi:hypothetical protein